MEIEQYVTLKKTKILPTVIEALGLIMKRTEQQIRSPWCTISPESE